tara:strand:+ start:474 stop:836 length:363 start_codon:yes stop_codon:yes gene_type:complete
MNSLDNFLKTSNIYGYDLFSNVQSASNTYKTYVEENNLVFKCLAPSYEKKDLDITIENKTLEIKSLKEKSNYDFYFDVNNKFKLYKEVDTKKTYASLDKGILTITMPIKKSSQKTSVNFV